MTELVAEVPRPRVGTAVRDLLELSKARIVVMILITTAAGFWLANPDGSVSLLLTLIGTGLVAAGTNAWNQYSERALDGVMRRTKSRPLPDGRMKPWTALLFSAGTATIGAVMLALMVGELAAILAVATLLVYVFVYTPLKRHTTLCTLIGAVPGAIPPMIGWAAAAGELGDGAWLLFALMFLWQIPHFLAIAWMYREDYARAGFLMLSVGDTTGLTTARYAVIYTLASIAVSVLPVALQMGGAVYLIGAIVAGLLLLRASLRFVGDRSVRQAKRLFLASNLYLVLVMGCLALGKAFMIPLVW